MYTALVFLYYSRLVSFSSHFVPESAYLSWNRVMLSRGFPYLSYPFLKYLTRIRLYAKFESLQQDFNKSPLKTTSYYSNDMLRHLRSTKKPLRYFRSGFISFLLYASLLLLRLFLHTFHTKGSQTMYKPTYIL